MNEPIPTQDDLQLAQLRRAAEISMRMIEVVDRHMSSFDELPAPAVLADLNKTLDRACRTLRGNIALERRVRAEAAGDFQIAAREAARRQAITDARDLAAARQRGTAAKQAIQDTVERLFDSEGLREALFDRPTDEDGDDEPVNLFELWADPDDADEDYDGRPDGELVAEVAWELGAAINWSNHAGEPWAADAAAWQPGSDDDHRPPKVDLERLNLWDPDPHPAPDDLAKASAAWRYYCQRMGRKPEPPE